MKNGKIIMKNKFVSGTFGAFALLICTLMFSSCAVVDWFAGKVNDQEVLDEDKAMSNVQEKKTRYENAIKQLGRMLEAYNITPTRVQCKVISNQTAEKGLPDDISRMMISSINKVGRTVIYVPYDPNYIVNETSTGGKIKRALPEMVIAGGITEFDRDLIEKERELKSDVQIQEGDFGSKYSHDGGAGYKSGSSISRMTLDLQALNYRTQSYLTGIQAINSIFIRRTNLGWTVGYFFQGSGGGFSYSLARKEGQYHAIRLLVELSVVEVLGKYFDVPYWRCLNGEGRNEKMCARLREEFTDLTDVEQIRYLKEYMFFHGLKVDRAQALFSDGEKAQVKTLMDKYKCHSYTDLFMQLWETVPIEAARKLNRDQARAHKHQDKIVASEYARKARLYNQNIRKADQLVNDNKLAEARTYYLKALEIFPDQQSPRQLISQIDGILNKNNKKQTTAVQTQVVQKNQTQTAPKAQVPKKEAPLNPFKKVSW